MIYVDGFGDIMLSLMTTLNGFVVPYKYLGYYLYVLLLAYWLVPIILGLLVAIVALAFTKHKESRKEDDDWVLEDEYYELA